MIAKYRKHVVETKLKKTYSVLYNALKFSENENGNLQYPAKELWDKNTYFSSAEFFDTYISPYLNNIVRSYTSNISKTVYLADNTKITYRARLFQWPWDKSAPFILGDFDIEFTNNTKKCITGKNCFLFSLYYAQQGKSGLDLIPIYRGGDYGIDPGVEGKCGEDIIKTNCADGVSSSCTKMIYCNGWKIPDDYPIKF